MHKVDENDTGAHLGHFPKADYRMNAGEAEPEPEQVRTSRDGVVLEAGTPAFPERYRA